MAAVMLSFFIPAFRASLWTLVSIFPNSSGDGGRIIFRTTVSPDPMTTNCAPGFRPRRSRTSSGMTTCPLDDSFVGDKASILHIRYSLTGKIVSRRKAGLLNRVAVPEEKRDPPDLSGPCPVRRELSLIHKGSSIPGGAPEPTPLCPGV